MTELNNCCGTTCDKAALAAEIAELRQTAANRTKEAELAKRTANELKQLNDELAAENEKLTNKVKALVSQLWRFRKIFRSDSYDAVSSVKSLREVAMVVDLSVDQMLSEHDREVASMAFKVGALQFGANLYLANEAAVKYAKTIRNQKDGE